MPNPSPLGFAAPRLESLVNALERAGADPAASATVNTAAVNTAMVTGGLITCTTPGAYRVISANLIIPANRSIMVSADVSFVDSITGLATTPLQLLLVPLLSAGAAQQAAATASALGILPQYSAATAFKPAVDYFPTAAVRGLADWYQQAPLEYNGALWAVYWSSAGLPTIARTPCPSSTQMPKLASAIWTTLALDTIGTAVTVATTSVDFGAANSFTITAHGWVTGTTVKYATGTGSVTGLTNGNTYWAIKIDSNTISLASSEDNSIAGTAVDITGVSAGNFTFTPNLPPTGAATDGHLYLTFGFDSAGRIIVFRNAHIGRVHWCYCNVSDATFSTASNWVVGGIMVADADEDAASYCTPTMCRDGTLLMHYRDGASGNGDQIVNAWNSTTKTWSRRCQLMGHGSGTTYNAYMTVHVAKSGRIHVAWNWTDTGSATGGTGHDIGYCYTDDNFVTVRRSNGAAYVLPIENATTEKAATIATGSYLIGPLQMFSHPFTGLPYIAYMRSDGTSSQYYLIQGIGSAPVVLTTWNYLYDIAASPIRNGRVGRPVVVITNSGRVLIVYRNSQQMRGALRCMDVTDTNNISDFPICKIDLYQKETPRIDDSAVIDHNRAHFFVAPIIQEGSAAPEDYFNANQWTVQMGLVCTIDLAQLDKLAAGCKVPGIEDMSQDWGSLGLASVTTTATPGEVLGSRQIFHADLNRSDYNVFFKHELKVKMDAAGTFTVRLLETKNDGTLVQGDYNQTTSTIFTSLKSPYMPLTAWPETQDCTMEWMGRVSATSATVVYAKMILGRLTLV